MDRRQELFDLVTRAQAGNRAAFEELVNRCQDMAVGYAYSILGDFAQAQNAAQEAFVQMYLDLPNLRAPAAFLSWLRRIVFKYCDRIIRIRRDEVISLETIHLVGSQDGNPAEIVANRETSLAVVRALRALPANERAVILLYYLQDGSLKEVAQFLETSVATVDHRLRLARRHMSERMFAMTQKDLQEQRPSRDAGFLTRVMDGLTQLATRQSFEARLRDEIRTRWTSQPGFGLVILDIDSFGQFNHEWGHVAGDCLLAAIGKQLTAMVAVDDFVARYGGEQFVLLIRRSTLRDVIAFAEKTRAAIAQTEYRWKDLLLPEARYATTDLRLPPSPANPYFQEGLKLLAQERPEPAVAAFAKALELDNEHVPSIMELEYLRLRQTLGSGQAAGNIVLRVTVSGGVAWLRPGDTAESILQRAQAHLVAAKNGGRDQIQPVS